MDPTVRDPRVFLFPPPARSFPLRSSRADAPVYGQPRRCCGACYWSGLPLITDRCADTWGCSSVPRTDLATTSFTERWRHQTEVALLCDPVCPRSFRIIVARGWSEEKKWLSPGRQSVRRAAELDPEQLHSEAGGFGVYWFRSRFDRHEPGQLQTISACPGASGLRNI